MGSEFSCAAFLAATRSKTYTPLIGAYSRLRGLEFAANGTLRLCAIQHFSVGWIGRGQVASFRVSVVSGGAHQFLFPVKL
jgi:hypothetical protein